MSLGVFVQQEHCCGEGDFVLLRAAEWHRQHETQESASARFVKAAADNPRDREHVGRAVLRALADQNVDAAKLS